MRAVTLVYPVAHGRVLLGFKKRGFGSGKLVGFGGAIEPGETAVQAAIRELAEESSLQTTPSAVHSAAGIRFHFPARPAWNHAVQVFRVSSWQGTARESSEMRPCWFTMDTIPYDLMWDDARYWLPAVLHGRRLTAEFVFQDDNATVASATLNEWPDDA